MRLPLRSTLALLAAPVFLAASSLFCGCSTMAGRQTIGNNGKCVQLSQLGPMFASWTGTYIDVFQRDPVCYTPTRMPNYDRFFDDANFLAGEVRVAVAIIKARKSGRVTASNGRKYAEAAGYILPVLEEGVQRGSQTVQDGRGLLSSVPRDFAHTLKIPRISRALKQALQDLNSDLVAGQNAVKDLKSEGAPAISGGEKSAPTPEASPALTALTKEPAPVQAGAAAIIAPAPSHKAGARGYYEEALTLFLDGNFPAALSSANEAIKQDSRLGAAFSLRARIWYVLGDRAHMQEDRDFALSKLRESALDAEDLVARGSALLLKGDMEGAISSFNAALQTKSPAAEALAARARVWRAKGDYAAEAADLTAALKLKPAALYFHNRAHAYYDLGQYDKAIADLSAALHANRNSYLSFGLLGTVMAGQGDTARALKAYDKAIALDPNYVYAYLGRAALRLSRGEDPAAFQDFGEAIRLAPHDFSPWFNRAEAYWRRGDQDNALADYRKALASDMPDARYAIMVGDRFVQRQLWQEAIAAYSRAADLGATAAPLIRRSAAWEALKDTRKAMDDLDAAARIEPASAAVWTAHGLLNMRLQHWDQTLEDFTRAVKLDPKAAKIRVARGSFYARTGKAQLALEDFNAAIASDPNLAEAYNNRGALNANAFNDTDKALNDIVSAAVLSPQNAGYQFNLGIMRLRARHYHKALEALETSLKLKGPVAPIMQARAEIYAQLGEHAAALRDIQLALEKDPHNPAVYDSLGLIRLAAHDYEAAVRDLNQALRISKDFVPALVHRATAYGALGTLKEAFYDLDRAAGLDAESKEAWTGLCTAKRLRQDYPGAVRDCTRALGLVQNYGPAYLQRGLAYLHLKDANRAIFDLNSAYQLGARRAEGLLALSYAHALAKQYREAHRAYLAAMALDPNARTFQAGFGPPSGDSDDYFAAISDIEALAASDATDPYVFVVRGDALHNAGHYDKAIVEFTKVMELDANVPDAYIGRGNCLFAQESYDAAQQDFLRAIELGPKDAGSRLRLATLLTVRRSYQPAMAAISAALKIDPKNSEAFLRAGNVYYFQGAYQKALDNYEVAAKYDANSAAAFNGVGMGYFALRKYPDALENFSRAISLGPTCDRYYRNRAATYVNLKEFGNAAAEFRSASLVNTDPGLVEEYQRLIKDAQAQIGGGST
jgi:tetratricopeptide (TPR) repeat protein